jgi:hypothetical protein
MIILQNSIKNKKKPHTVTAKHKAWQSAQRTTQRRASYNHIHGAHLNASRELPREQPPEYSRRLDGFAQRYCYGDYIFSARTWAILTEFSVVLFSFSGQMQIYCVYYVTTFFLQIRINLSLINLPLYTLALLNNPQINKYTQNVYNITYPCC